MKTTIEQIRAAFPGGQQRGEWYSVTCPVCERDGKLGIKVDADGTVGVSCLHKDNGQDHNDAAYDKVCKRLDERAPASPSKPQAAGLTLAQYAAQKNLPLEFLKAQGVTDGKFGGMASVRFPYFNADGKPAGFKHRKDASLKADKATMWQGHVDGCDLYGLNRFAQPPDTIVIVEGESDTDTLALLGVNAIGVSGVRSWRRDFAKLPVFSKAEVLKQVYVVQEPEAAEFASAVCDSFAPDAVRVITLDEKDPSDLWLGCAGSREAFNMAWTTATSFATTRERSWRKTFFTLAEMQSAPPRELIKGILIEGLNYNGAGSCVGKTWKTMSEACALCTGRKFAGVFEVPERVPVLYLMAEQGNGSVYRRAQALRMPLTDENLLFHTLSHGVLQLNDKNVLAAVADMRPVVFLDTAIRFSHVKDENAAAENASGLYHHMSELMRAGALAICCNHHTNKASIRGGVLLELEDLRGTGDIGAMCDIVWMIQTYRGPAGAESTSYFEESKRLTRVLCRNVKPREIETKPFVLVGRPHIDRDGDFRVLDETVTEAGLYAHPKGEAMAAAVRLNTNLSASALAEQFKVSRNAVASILAQQGFRKSSERGPWVETPPLTADLPVVDADEPF